MDLREINFVFPFQSQSPYHPTIRGRSILAKIGKNPNPPLSRLEGLSSLAALRKRFITEDLRQFAGKHLDLLRFIQKDERLKEILKTRSVQTREDLEEVVISGALERLKPDTLISRGFLEQNFTLAQFISQNIGGLADLLNQDKSLARDLIRNGSAIGGQTFNEVVQKALDLVGPGSPITEVFLEDHIEAALYLLQQPTEAAKLKRNPSEAQQFVNELGLKTATLNETTVALAESLLNKPATFSTTFLEENIGFARLVVASDLVEDGQSLSEFVRSLSFLENESVSTESLVSAYESRLAANQFSPDFPLSEAFFVQNRPLTFLVLRSDAFTEHLKRQEGELEKLFGPGPSSSTPVEKGILPLVADLFQSRFEPFQGGTLDLYA